MSKEAHVKWAEFRTAFIKETINKSGENKHQNYKYYLLEDIEKVLSIAIEKTGYSLILISQNKDPNSNLWNFKYSFNGELFFTYQFEGDNQQKNPIQSSGSTSTYGHRYALMRLLGVADIDTEPDAKDQSDTTTTKTRPQPKKLITPIKPPQEIVVESVDTTKKVEEPEKMSDIMSQIIANKKAKKAESGGYIAEANEGGSDYE